jgi:uncharacterized protein YbaR (Trm112 family)
VENGHFRESILRIDAGSPVVPAAAEVRAQRGVTRDPASVRRIKSWCYDPRPMAIDNELLEILACPLCKQEVKLVPLSEAKRTLVRDKYREKFRGEEPVVEQGLQCVKCHRVYPIVSDIPVMLVEEAFDEA